jgi:uncharacterized protein YqgQ
MVVYKVFCKNYELRKGELMGALIERRKDLRGMKQFESGLKWAKLTFGHMVQDKKAIFVVPSELKIEDNPKRYMEKGIFTKEEFLEMLKVVDREMKKERKGN